MTYTSQHRRFCVVTAFLCACISAEALAQFEMDYSFYDSPYGTVVVEVYEESSPWHCNAGIQDEAESYWTPWPDSHADYGFVAPIKPIHSVAPIAPITSFIPEPSRHPTYWQSPGSQPDQQVHGTSQAPLVLPTKEIFSYPPVSQITLEAANPPTPPFDPVPVIFLLVFVAILCFLVAIAFHTSVEETLQQVTVPTANVKTQSTSPPTKSSAPRPGAEAASDPYAHLPFAKADRLRTLDRERDQAIAILLASSLDPIGQQYAISEVRAEYQAKTAQALRS